MIASQRRSHMLALGMEKLRGAGGHSPPKWVLPGRIGCWAHSAPEKPQFTGQGCGDNVDLTSAVMTQGIRSYALCQPHEENVAGFRWQPRDHPARRIVCAEVEHFIGCNGLICHEFRSTVVKLIYTHVFQLRL